MRAPNAWLAAGALALAACVSNPAPRGWLPPAEIVAREAYGGWIVVDTGAGDRRGWYGAGRPAVEVAGELIAVDPETVFVMTQSRLLGVVKAQVRRATLFAYDAEWGRLAAWGTLGTLSTVSNGAFLLLTAPTWIITSALAASSRSWAPMVELADLKDRWEKLRLYARFPQGLPAGLDRNALRAAPLRTGWR